MFDDKNLHNEEKSQSSQDPDQNTPSAYQSNDSSSGSPYTDPKYQQQSYQNGPYHQDQRKGPGPQDDFHWNYDEYEAARKKSHTRRGRGVAVFGILLAVVLTVGVVFLAGYGIYGLVAAPEEEQNQVTTENRTTPELTIKDHPVDPSDGQIAADGKMTTTQIAKEVRPSVVGVIQYANNSFTPTGEGSGIIMNSDGYIVTNAHVVEGAIGINVVLDHGENYAAKLIGIDTKTDLAVIKIEAENLVSATFGNSDQLEVGDKVIAIGNPGGVTLMGSVSQGIVSGLRSLSDDSGYSSDYIQTDAAINPGNSGGALVNEYGQVVGINSSKIADVDYEGIGFAIPINEAKPIIDDLMEYGYVTGRVKLGISGVAINETLSQIRKLPTGIMIYSIDATSDLAGRNVAQYDIITAIDGKAVASFNDVSSALEGKKPGDTVELTLYRASRAGVGDTFTVNCKLMEDIEGTAGTIS